MLELLANPELRIFSTLFFVVFGLLALEVVLMLIGISSQIGEGDIGFDVDADVDLGAESLAALESVDAADMIDIEPVGLDAFDIDAADAIDGLDGFDGLDGLDDIDVLSEAQAASVSTGGLLDMLGVTKVPSAIWLAGLLMFVAIFGFMLQGLVGILGFGFLPSTLALAIVAVPGLFVTAKFARFVGGLIPSMETSAVGAHAFHKRVGKVSGGTARKGRAAEVKWKDGYENTHYLMAEPLDPKEEIAEGTDVLILRTKTKEARIIAL